LPENAPLAVKLGVSATIDDMNQAKALASAAGAKGAAVHLDLDFGLGRWGIAPKRLPEFLSALKQLKRVKLAGLSTHIDYVPGKNAVEAEEKLRAFSKLAQRLKAFYPDLVCHAANSSVLMDFPHWQLDTVRVGNLIYGINASKSKSTPLKRPFHFYARIVALRDVARGRSIGYASEYIAARALRVATLPAGYADGVTMEPAERLIGFGSGFQYWGMLGGKKTPFVGRCGISHVLVDVTAARSAKLGDAVLLPVRRTAASAHLRRVYKR
jgi:alanine racemase